MPEPPSEIEVLSWFDSLSNWGRWGVDDQFGTLNLITPAVRRRAAQLVREGLSVSCSWDVEASVRGPVQRFMLQTGEGLHDQQRVHGHQRFVAAAEYVGLTVHRPGVTHIDALSHVFWGGQMYNGKSAELVSSWHGATANDITMARTGVFTRAVLFDIPVLRGVAWLSPGDSVYPEDLEAAEEHFGFLVAEGDAVVLRTGYSQRRREIGPLDYETDGQAGLHAAVLPWLFERGVSVVACDTAADVIPSGYSEMPLPIHVIGIAAMGLWTIDHCDLEALASTCTELSRWEFLFSVAPIPIRGATGSPVNPIAYF